MGAVWLGRDEVLHRPVALKKIGMAPGGSSPDLLRAEREARIAASLNHPHVVGVFDLVDDADHQWLVMEYFAGTTLSDLVRSSGALDVATLAPIAAQVAEALAAAHEAGIIHRDVKPSNILVREDGQVKISDFGIARAQADASLTQTGLVTGSPAYLAPEIASGKAATPAADAWSFGATLFHALAGHPPYDVGDNVLGALYRIVNEEPPRLATAGPMAPLLEATMTREPGSRWSMAEVLRFLHRLDEGGVSPPLPAAAVFAADDDDHDSTQVLATPPQPFPPAPPADATPAPSPAPAPVPPPAPAAGPAHAAAPTRRRRSPVLPVVIGVLVVALVVAIVLLATLDDPQREPTARPGDDTSSSEPTEPSTSESTPSAPDAEAMAQFASDYVSTASTDPDAGFQQLTTDYQDASPGYADFWGKVRDPEILEGPTADPDALTVTYTYRYGFEGDSVTETVTLRLVPDGDSFLISGASS